MIIVISFDELNMAETCCRSHFISLHDSQLRRANVIVSHTSAQRSPWKSGGHSIAITHIKQLPHKPSHKDVHCAHEHAMQC